MVSAPPVYPTVTVTVHRIITVDPVEGVPGDPADWFYYVGVDWGAGYQWQSSGNLPDNTDVLTVDRGHPFPVQSVNVTIAIMLCEEDFILPADDELADLSGDMNGGQDDVDCSPPATGTLPGTFVASWNLGTGVLSGDAYTMASGYYEAYGESDGSTVADENDANLQFLVGDDYTPPGADAGPDLITHLEEPVNLDASNSTASPGSSIESYAWDFGDGRTDSGASPFVTHIYSAKGVFTVTLRVNDSLGMTSTDTATVFVQNLAPDVSFAFTPRDPTTATDIAFTDTSLDPDGGIDARLWEFGDGSTSPDANPTHRYSDDGNYSVTLTVTDDEGATASMTQWVNVSNVDPVASFAATPVNPEVGDPVAFTDRSVDADGEIAAWSWDFGDGNASSERSPTHTYGESGTFTVTLLVTDDDGGTGSWERGVTIAPRETAPQAAWTSAIILIVLVVVVLVALYLWRRYSRGGEEGG
jgi:PKD repeat protein